MNNRNLFFTFVFCLVCFCGSLVARAENGGYFDPQYDFSKLQNIEVHMHYDAPERTYATLLLSFPSQVVEKLNKKDFHAYLDEAVLKTNKTTQPDTYLTKDTMNASEIIQPDAHLVVRIEDVSTQHQYSPGYVDWQPRVYYVPVVNDKGEHVGYSSYVDYESYYVPDRHWLSHYLLIQYTLYDAQTGQAIVRYAYARNSSLALADLARKTAGDFASRLTKERKKAKEKH